MAIGTNAFTTYDATGNREDLTGLITNISPVEAWFTSNTANGTAKARLHEWQTDALPAAAANAHVEGEVVTANAATATSRLNNNCQILQQSFAITDTQETVDKAGRDSEIAYQKAKFLKALANDIEYALIINSATVTGATGTARQMKGALGFIATNVTTATSATSASGINETDFNSTLQLVWAQGGDPKNVLVGAIQKKAISAFTGNNTRFQSIDAGKLRESVDTYLSDFGTVTIRKHYIMQAGAAGSVLILGDMGLWAKAWMRKSKWEQLARTGSFLSYFVEAELTLESRQEKGSGKCTGYKSS